MKKLLSIFLLIFAGSINAEINLVSFQFGQDNPTTVPTVYWGNVGSKALVIFLPGGSGSFGVTKKTRPKAKLVISRSS